MLQFFLFCGFLHFISTQDIVGCGGFVESDVSLSFEKISVKLYTKQGAFKFKTECAPNNGYFLVPVYDMGDYTIQIEPPDGWGFKPQKIELSIDGKTDSCSKGEDLNFKFSGFTVTGEIGSIGREKGPAGVTIELFNKETTLVGSSTTDENGRFVFKDIMPGEYKIKASHSSWSMKKDEQVFTVTDNNINLESLLQVAGYDVKGHVLSSGEPIEGVSFILFSDIATKDQVFGCENVPNDVLSRLKQQIKEKPLCLVFSAKDGTFNFPTVPSGDYVLVPYYMAQNILFDVVPQKLSFSVNYKTVVLKTPFQVYGFSVRGRVIDTQGKGIPDVKVTAINSQGESRSAKSKPDGTYLIENVTTDHYTMKLQKEHYFFDEQKVHITPNTPHVKDITSSRVGVCGTINVFHIPKGVLQVYQRKIILHMQNKSITASSIQSTNPDREGKFCFFTDVGVFKLEVHIGPNEKQLGFQLQPEFHTVEVKNEPILGLDFHQFSAKVSGTIQCLEQCGDVDVYIAPIDSPNDKSYAKLTGEGASLSFTFQRLLPGKYKVTPVRKNWCWNPQSIDVIIEDKDVGGVELKHSGYHLKCKLSHDISLEFSLDSSKENVGSFELKKGSNQFCLKTPGTYTLTPKSCYQFEKETYTYETASPKLLTLNVKSYKVIVEIKSQKQVTDLKVDVRSSSGETYTLEKADIEKVENIFIHKFVMWHQPLEELLLKPHSKQILFTPKKETITVKEGCPGASAIFVGEEGIFIEGSISPPFKSVVVTITTEATEIDEAQVINVLTDEAGKYRVGPMRGNVKYETSAFKEGYFITPIKESKGSFKAQKLGHITVKVTSESDEPQPGVLLSLSGGHYRNNNITSNDGSFVFSNLGPGQYFLKPMQKEYHFDPSSKMVDVSEGEDVFINIKGKRVAFSCSGLVSSLSGIPQDKVAIEAVGMHKCSEYQESAMTDESGIYKLRGLQPGCAYNIRMMKNDQNKDIERLAPANHVFQIQHEDLSNVNFIVFMRSNKFQLTAQIDTEFEHLPTLKVLLYDEKNLNSPILTMSPGVFKFIEFPLLQPKTYVVKLQTTLSHATHQTESSTATVIPNADLSKKHIKLKFQATQRKIDMEPTQSVIALPFAVALVFLAYNYDSFLIFLVKVNLFIQSFNKQDDGESGDEQAANETSSRKKKKL